METILLNLYVSFKFEKQYDLINQFIQNIGSMENNICCFFIQHKTRIVQNKDQNIIYPEINDIDVLLLCLTIK